VVREVVGAERRRIRDADWDIGKDGDETVGKRRAEGKVMGDLMDREEAVLVGRCADDVCCEEELPGEEGCVSEEVGAGYLEGDHAGNNIFRQWLRTTELRHLESG